MIPSYGADPLLSSVKALERADQKSLDLWEGTIVDMLEHQYEMITNGKLGKRGQQRN
jgi:hypothetical protein